MKRLRAIYAFFRWGELEELEGLDGAREVGGFSFHCLLFGKGGGLFFLVCLFFVVLSFHLSRLF